MSPCDDCSAPCGCGLSLAASGVVDAAASDTGGELVALAVVDALHVSSGGIDAGVAAGASIPVAVPAAASL
jgi:hypothetical protein